MRFTPRARVCATLAALSCIPAPTVAQGVKAVREIAGAECRKARETAATLAGDLPAAHASPAAMAPVVGRVGSTVFAVPAKRANGFIGVVLPDGQEGWLNEAWVAPWPSDTVCSVVLLNNGRIGWQAR